MATEKWVHPVEQYAVQNEAIAVADGGVVNAVSGTLKTVVLSATDANLTDKATNATSFIEVAGLQGFGVDYAVVIPSGQQLLVGWSTLANDSAAVAAALNALDVAAATPDAGGTVNVLPVTPYTSQLPAILWDGSNTIKTIGVRMAGGVLAQTVFLRTVE